MLTMESGTYVADLQGTAWQDSISSASCDSTYPALRHTILEFNGSFAVIDAWTTSKDDTELYRPTILGGFDGI